MGNCSGSTCDLLSEDEKLNRRIGIGCGFGLTFVFFGALSAGMGFATPDASWATEGTTIQQAHENRIHTGEAGLGALFIGAAGIVMGVKAARKLHALELN